ncbi:MAG: ABC transporter permease subunit [Chloroflexi bacterium]|nr:ABC transporter permease subunit [Chloroflexota bacterium]
MRTVQAVAWKEIQVYFGTPIAYIVGMIFLVVTGIIFASGVVPSENNPFPEAALTAFFQSRWTIFFVILLAPTLTMRLISEEQKMGTIELLLTSPVRDWEIIVGKYLASLAFLVALLALTLYYPLMLFIFAEPDPGPIFSGYLGLVLFGASALAIGMLTSTITSNQIVAAIVGIGLIGALFVVDFSSDLVEGVASVLVNEIGSYAHYEDFSRGVIDTKHVVYFLSVTAVFLFLAIRALEFRRWR